MTIPRPLTDAEQRVAGLIAEGFTDKQIAATIGRSAGLVRKIVDKIADAWHLDRARNLRVQIAKHLTRSA